MYSGQDIRQKRKSQGISMKQLADILGVSTSLVSYYETGRTNVSQNNRGLIDDYIEGKYDEEIYETYGVRPESERLVFTGQDVRQKRKSQGISTYELSDFLGINRTRLCLYETGKEEISKNYKGTLEDYLRGLYDEEIYKQFGLKQGHEKLSFTRHDIREKRLSQSLTFTRLSSLLGIEKGMLRRYETGNRKRISLEHVDIFEKYLSGDYDKEVYSTFAVQQDNDNEGLRSGLGIRQKREQQGITMKELSGFLQIDHTLLSRYETGKRKISFNHVELIQKYLSGEYDEELCGLKAS